MVEDRFAQDAQWVQDHIRPIVECGSSLLGPRSLRKLTEPAAAAGGQPAAMEMSTDPVVERAGGAAPRPDVRQVQPMEVSLEQRVTTGATKRAAQTQLTPNTVEEYIGGFRSFDGHQDVQRDVMSAIETTNDDSAADTIDEDSRRYEFYTGELLDRDKYIPGRMKELDQLESFGNDSACQEK